MLILTRKLGESITIGDDVRITVMAVKGNQVKIGIEAPTETKVHREEIYMSIMEGNKKTNGESSPDAPLLQTIWKDNTSNPNA